MLRALGLATLLLVIPSGVSGQAPSVLHISVLLVDADQKTTPVPRHVLLISDNPTSALPRRIVTAVDGTADVSLRPGSYTVESDRPVAFQGKAYEWTATVEIAAGKNAALELTAGNAEIVPFTSPPGTSAATASTLTTSPAPLEADPTFLLPQWQDSVVGLWTPTSHASGFVVDAKGLVVTSQRAIGTATTVEVQLTPAVKVAASVLAADVGRDVAVLWINPSVAGSLRPVLLGCTLPATPPVASGQDLFTITAPLREPKDMAPGTVSRVEPHAILSDFDLAAGGAGGPVFTAAGTLVGIASMADEGDDRRRGNVRVVPIDDACDVVMSVEKKMQEAAPPAGTHLPVEPLQAFPIDALKDAALRRAGSLSPYLMTASDFDVAFITPVMIYGEQHQGELVRGRAPGGSARRPETDVRVTPLMDFSNWSEYVEDLPPVLLVRVTPKAVESLWTTVARGAAMTQGISLPPIKHFKSGFSRMRAFCGDTEVTPIHPFTLERRVSETEAIYEGLYVFDPGALGPQCASVKLVLYSEKEPERADTRVIDPKVVQQIWQDFAPLRVL